MFIIDKVELSGLEAAVRGMRNPMNSWDKSDSYFTDDGKYVIGHNDVNLMCRLINAGKDHRKFTRMIHISADVTAPLYWWKEYDTYKIGTVANSCSTMHTIHKEPFDLDSFSLDEISEDPIFRKDTTYITPMDVAKSICDALNLLREKFLETKDKSYWYQMIQLLPSSYNQKRTIDISLEAFLNMYRARENHKLDEWIYFNVGMRRYILEVFNTTSEEDLNKLSNIMF